MTSGTGMQNELHNLSWLELAAQSICIEWAWPYTHKNRRTKMKLSAICHWTNSCIVFGTTVTYTWWWTVQFKVCYTLRTIHLNYPWAPWCVLSTFIFNQMQIFFLGAATNMAGFPPWSQNQFSGFHPSPRYLNVDVFDTSLFQAWRVLCLFVTAEGWHMAAYETSWTVFIFFQVHFKKLCCEWGAVIDSPTTTTTFVRFKKWVAKARDTHLWLVVCSLGLLFQEVWLLPVPCLLQQLPIVPQDEAQNDYQAQEAHDGAHKRH